MIKLPWPNLMYRNTKGIGAVTDLGIKAQFINRFELGFSVRTGCDFSVQAIVNANENFSLGYTYDHLETINSPA